MGQATLDLPDLLSPPANGTAVNADDLMSQLAGDEIDRMLAEADVDRAQDEDSTDAPAPSPPATEAALEHELDDLNSELGLADDSIDSHVEEELDAVEAATSTTELTNPQIQSQLSSELDELIDEINHPQPPAPDDLPAAPALDPDPAATAALHPPAEPADIATPQADAEASPPSDADVREEQAATAALLESIEPTAPPVPLPIWLRPLEWLNAPLAGLTDAARSTLGKAALITLFNAIVILLYVLLFRK